MMSLPNKAETKLPERPAYPSRYNGLQAGWLAATFALAVMAFLAYRYLEAAYLLNGIIGFYIARIGLENPKPKEEKKP